jgi:hypothetical protein
VRRGGPAPLRRPQRDRAASPHPGYAGFRNVNQDSTMTKITEADTQLLL